VIGDDVEERVLAALAGGASKAAACRAGPMSQRSLRRRLQEPDFCARLCLKREVVSSEIDGNLRALASKSVYVITKILERDDLPALQLKAALAVLPTWIRTRSFDLDARMDELLALAHEQDTAIVDMNRIITRVRSGVVGDASQDETTGGTQ
jgi:hypothetical protein